MGDMINCAKCGSHHYRNDGCPEELLPPSAASRYKVWVQVEELDEDGEPLRDLDLPFAASVLCDNERDALQSAMTLHNALELLAAAKHVIEMRGNCDIAYKPLVAAIAKAEGRPGSLIDEVV